MRITELQLGSAAFDQPAARGAPAQKLLILAPPRSGSYMLCRYMWHAGLGVPHEYFNEIHIRLMGRRWKVPDTAQGGVVLRDPAVMLRYLHALMAHRTRGGLFAAKIQYKQYELFLRGPVAELLFDGAALIYLTRRDTVAQAVSRHFAQVTGRWSFEPRLLTQPRGTEALFDVDTIAYILAEIRAEEVLWERLFGRLGRTPLRIAYEDICDDPATTLDAIAALCGVPAGAVDKSYDDAGRYDVDAALPSKEAVATFFRENYQPRTVARPRAAVAAGSYRLPATAHGGMHGLPVAADAPRRT